MHGPDVLNVFLEEFSDLFLDEFLDVFLEGFLDMFLEESLVVFRGRVFGSGCGRVLGVFVEEPRISYGLLTDESLIKAFIQHARDDRASNRVFDFSLERAHEHLRNGPLRDHVRW